MLDRVWFDLTSAGIRVALPQPLSGEYQGGAVLYLDDDRQVTVDWLTHHRLDAASLDMVDANRLEEEVVTRYDTIRTTMNTALGIVLHTFGYRTSRPLFGGGFTVQHSRPTPTAAG
ncbi:hypothetical protein ACIQHY_34285 [Streptomyces sp. NPDC092359]|uniref:hypothetical protein n=1 Tax=Streptomyces sp. NPDC092359 TaxID=3366014 RepID=UPI0038283DD9